MTPTPEKTATVTTCAHCATSRSTEEVEALPLAKKNGGRVRYEGETHEHRVCSCGNLLLTVHPHLPSVASIRPRHDTPAPMLMASDAHDRRK